MAVLFGLFVFGFFIFVLVGIIKGYIAAKDANLALRKVESLYRKLDGVEEKANRLERGLDTLRDSMMGVGGRDEESEEAREAVSTSADAAPEAFEIPTSPIVIKDASVSSSLPKQSNVTTDESGTEDASTPIFESDQGAVKEPDLPGSSVADIPKRRPRWVTRFEGMNWETFVGTYLLRIVGVVLVTIAVFTGLALVAQKTGPGFRVFLGYCVSAGLLAGGRFTERKQPGYARVVYGGGLAVAYFVTFATHYIPLSRIFESPLPSLGGMAVIVGIWAAIAQIRRSPTIAALVTVLGHFTIALTTFTVSNPGMYSVFGVVILSCGSAFFLLRNRWYYIAAVGMLASYANHFALLVRSTGTDTVAEFTLGMGVLTTYLLIFALAELYSPEDLRRDMIPNWFRSIFVALNTSCYFALGSLLVEGYSFSEESHHLFRYCLAAVMLGIGLLYFIRRRHDPLYNTYMTKAIALTTFGLAFQFSGNALTTWLAIEMLVLLASAWRSGLVVTRMLAHGVAVIAFAHGVFGFLAQMDFVSYNDSGYAGTLIRVLIPVAAFGFFSLLYERTDWGTRMRFGLNVPKDLHTLFWQLDFVPDPLPESKVTQRPLNGLLFPYVYAVAAGVLFLGYSLRVVDIDDRFNVYGLIGVGLLVIGWVLNARPYVLVSFLYVGLALVMTFHSMVDTAFPTTYMLGVIALVFCALATEKGLVPYRDSLVLYRKTLSPYLLYGVALWSIALYITHYFEGQEYIIALLVLSVICGGLARRLHAHALGLGATVILFCGHLMWHIDYIDLGEYFSNPNSQGGLASLIAGLIVILCVVGDRFSVRWNLDAYGSVLVFIAFTTGLHYIHHEAARPWFGFFGGLMALGFLGYGILVRSTAAGAFSLLTTLVVSLTHVGRAYDAIDEQRTISTIIGFVMLIALWIVFERLNNVYTSRRFERARSPFTVLCIVATTLLALILLERIPALSDLYLTVSWALLAVVFFGVALMSTQKRYRYAGLAILALSTFRVIVYDTSTLDATNRVLAFGGLGVVLLGLGFGYSRAFGEGKESQIEDGNK